MIKPQNNIIPVLSKDNIPLMPTSYSRAKKWIVQNKATPFIKFNLLCIRLNFDIINSNTKKETVVVGIDPGSKREAYTVKCNKTTFLNIQCNAIDWVKDKIISRAQARRRRRQNLRFREPRFNNRGASIAKDRLPPSTKARWQLKLNIIKQLKSIYPITDIKIEDIAAITKEGKKKWNQSFSPLEQGKKYFKSEVEKMSLKYHEIKGYDTFELRQKYHLNKSKEKLSEGFDAHCVDSWVIANSLVGGHSTPDNTKILFIQPIQWQRRNLHKQQHASGGSPSKNSRIRFGGTMSFTFKNNSIVKWKDQFCLIAGFDDKDNKKNISLKPLSGKNKKGKGDIRITRTAKIKDIKFIKYNRYYIR